MAGCALRANAIVRSTIGVAAVLIACTGCNSTPTLPQLPTAAKPPRPREEISQAGLQYRQTSGEAIAPVVLQDDPAPSVAPPAGSGQQGGGGSLNGHPNGITRETLNRSIQGAMGALAACFTNITQDPMVAVAFEADPSGRPSLVRLSGAPPEAEKCIRSVVQGMRFPAFEGKSVQVDLPLSFHRAAQPAQPANRGGEQQGQGNAPPLFLEP
jgi:hypothetical protein